MINLADKLNMKAIELLEKINEAKNNPDFVGFDKSDGEIKAVFRNEIEPNCFTYRQITLQRF